MTIWKLFATSVKHTCFYSYWLARRGWYFMEMEWLCSKVGAKSPLQGPMLSFGEFLYNWLWHVLNAWARLKRSYSTDYFPLTAGDNEAKIVSLWTLQEQRSRWEEPHEVLAVECFDMPSAVCLGSEHRLMALWFKATQWQFKTKWGSVGRDVNSQMHLCHLRVEGLERARCVWPVKQKSSELCLSTGESSLLD